MAKQVEPRIHTGGSRFNAAVGEGSGRGFRYGLLGAAVGLLAVPAAAVGLAALAGVSGAFALTAIGVGSALVLSPITVGATAIGTALGGLIGINNGAKDANRRTGQEHEAARYVASYNQTRAQVQNAMMSQMMEAEPQMAAANDNPYHQAASQIDASTIAHEQTVAQQAEKARG